MVGRKDRQAYLPYNNKVHIGTSYNWYWVGVSIPENEDIDFTLYPCISVDGKYSQAWMNNKQGKFKRYFVSIDSKTDLNIKDKKLFKRFIKCQCQDCSSIEIDYLNDNSYVENSKTIVLDNLANIAF